MLLFFVHFLLCDTCCCFLCVLSFTLLLRQFLCRYARLHLLTCPYKVIREEFATLVYFCVRSVLSKAGKRREARRQQQRSAQRERERSRHRNVPSSGSVGFGSMSSMASLTGSNGSFKNGPAGGGSANASFASLTSASSFQTNTSQTAIGINASTNAGGSSTSDRNITLFTLSRVISFLVSLLPVVGDEFPHQAEQFFQLLYVSRCPAGCCCVLGDCRFLAMVVVCFVLTCCNRRRIVSLCSTEPRAVRYLLTSGMLETLVNYFAARHERVEFDEHSGHPLAVHEVPPSLTVLLIISGMHRPLFLCFAML